MAATRNQRMAWMAGELGKLRSNGAICQEAMGLFAISLGTAKKDLAEIYEHWASFSKENAEADKHKVLEALWASVDGARAMFNYNAVIAGLREIAKIQGNYAAEKVNLSGSLSTTGAPAANTVRARMQALLADPEIRKRALKAGLGIDFDKIDVVGSQDGDESTSDS